MCYNTLHPCEHGYFFVVPMTTPITFLKEVADELKKVVWPTRSEIVRLTGVVIIISVIVGLYIGAIDFAFTKTTELILK